MTLRLRLAIILTVLLARTSVAAFDLFGLRKSLYNPRCAHACREPMSTSVLECTSSTTKKTPAECYATDDSFLQSLGYCISMHCTTGLDDLEHYWRRYAVGWEITNPEPKYNYQTAVRLAGNPNETMWWGAGLDKVYTISDDDYKKSYDSLLDWSSNENLHSKYALALFLCGFMVPVLLSLLRFVPVSKKWASALRARFIYPTVCRYKWSMQIREAGDISPTRGQACFILYMLILNIVFLGTGHFGSMYSFWSLSGRHGQLITCLANRFGALALANIPLLFLYAGRNNFLLWVTNWSHCTFIMIHRWLGYIVIAEIILHSILYVNVAVQRQEHTLWSHVPAWYFGIIGTVSVSLIAPLSIVYVRKRIYEVFLFMHILITILALVGTCFHLTYLYNTQISGWIVYLWACVILWATDRMARIVRLTFNGVKRAHVTIIDEDYIRVDIPAARGRGHAYLYFPTLTWRFWENHPFSVATTPRRSEYPTSYLSKQLGERNKAPIALDICRFHSTPLDDLGSPGSDAKFIQRKENHGSPLSTKSPLSPLSPFTPVESFADLKHFTETPCPSQSIRPLLSLPFSEPESEKTKGLTFFMRVQSGTTAKLRQRSSLPVLTEASYGSPKDLTRYPVLICVAGGVGITAILPYLHAHQGITRLYWGSRSQRLVDALRGEIQGYGGEISAGRRLFVKMVLQSEIARYNGTTPIAVVVSGPKTMCEEVREFCCEIALKRTGEVRLLDESFSW